MFMLLLLALLFVAVLSVAVAVLVKGNASLKAQHRAYVNASNSVTAELKQKEKCFRLHAEAFELESLQKDEELQELKGKVAILEKLSAEKEAELAEATASEFAAKAKLANTSANYAKVEAYALEAMKKSSPSIFGDCNPRLDEKFIFEDELGIHWFK